MQVVEVFNSYFTAAYSYIKEQFVCVGVLACLFDDASRHFQHYFSYILAVSFIG
jgi:hypothetical protein